MICCVGAAIGVIIGLALGGTLMLIIPGIGFILGIMLDIIIYGKLLSRSNKHDNTSKLKKQPCCSIVIKKLNKN